MLHRRKHEMLILGGNLNVNQRVAFLTYNITFKKDSLLKKILN